MTSFLGRGAALSLVALTAAFGDAAAQPTQAQQSAIRNNCRGDFQSFCAGVQPGGQAALSCLQQNAAKATPACQQALGAVSGASQAPAAQGGGGAGSMAPAAGGAMAPQGGTMQGGGMQGGMQGGGMQGGGMQGGGMQGGMQGGGMGRMTMREELMITRQSCGQDYRTFCQGVQPGEGRAITCLEANGSSLSPGCQKALLDMKQRMGK